MRFGALPVAWAVVRRELRTDGELGLAEQVESGEEWFELDPGLWVGPKGKDFKETYFWKFSSATENGFTFAFRNRKDVHWGAYDLFPYEWSVECREAPQWHSPTNVELNAIVSQDVNGLISGTGKRPSLAEIEQEYQRINIEIERNSKSPEVFYMEVQGLKGNTMYYCEPRSSVGEQAENLPGMFVMTTNPESNWAIPGEKGCAKRRSDIGRCCCGDTPKYYVCKDKEEYFIGSQWCKNACGFLPHANDMCAGVQRKHEGREVTAEMAPVIGTRGHSCRRDHGQVSCIVETEAQKDAWEAASKYVFK